MMFSGSSRLKSRSRLGYFELVKAAAAESCWLVRPRRLRSEA